MSDLRDTAEFAALAACAARLGADPLQVQGPGGNVSLKAGGTMLVKASGTWLADAATADVFSPVDAAGLKAALLAGDPSAETPQAFQLGEGLRPSIEASFHAALDAPVVLHTHCVATLARSLRPVPAAELDALRLVHVPYVKPGADLARAVLAAWQPGARGAVLANHGIIAAAETVAEAGAVLAEARQRFDTGPAPQAAAALDAPGWRALPPGATNALAFDPARLAMAAGLALCPDQVIFLGPEPLVADTLPADPGPVSGLVLVPGRGAAMAADASPAAIALAQSLGEIVFRLPAGTEPSRLTGAECRALLGWDAEKYRQALEAERTARQMAAAP
ncbi:class II aldolase/adducin family protein [Poseidonocella sp. HB161398]|uniref:class II aldolase/adducin family protein n=1 Tax=Poseidonocella sp. HB161398 TaxID=2320855 RepID=UPI001486CE33|nr:class II aldolase/adducin family protein [Poseidonocella sp. HB161398]